jgi:hypothetical protein
MTMTDLATRRDEAATKLDSAKRAAATAILDSRKPDTAAVLTAQAEFEAVDLAESEQAHRDRAAQEAAYRSRQTETRADLIAALDARQAAVAMAETACRNLASAIKAERGASQAVTVALAGLGVVAPTSMMKSERERRLGGRIIAVLQPSMSHPRHYGSISFGPHHEVLASESWTAAEAREVDAVIQPLTKG